MNLRILAPVTIALSLVLSSGFAQAQCSGGGMYDPQGGVCHQAGGGYTVPNSIQGGGSGPSNKPWGALAIDVVNGEGSGLGLQWDTQNGAETAALRQCKIDKNCKVVASFKNSCGSVASSDGDVYGIGVDADPVTAERKALTQCNQRNGVNCQLWVKAGCAGQNYNKIRPTK